MNEMVSFRVPKPLRRQLDKICKTNHLAMSEAGREAIRRYVVAEQLKQIRARLRPHAEAQGYFTDEDVFKAVS